MIRILDNENGKSTKYSGKTDLANIKAHFLQLIASLSSTKCHPVH